MIEIDQRRSVRQLELDPAVLATARDLYGQGRDADGLFAALSLNTKDQRGRILVRLAGIGGRAGVFRARFGVVAARARGRARIGVRGGVGVGVRRRIGSLRWLTGNEKNQQQTCKCSPNWWQ